jgi:hypothetical protein
MPTIIREGGYRVVIYPNDHSPPHAHVLKGESEIRVDLGSKDNLPTLITIRGSISNREVAKGLGLVIRNQELCLNRWREIHG